MMCELSQQWAYHVRTLQLAQRIENGLIRRLVLQLPHQQMGCGLAIAVACIDVQ